MKRFLLALLAFSFSGLSLADSAINALDKQLSSTDTFQANFIQSTQSKQFGNQITKGEMTLQRPGKFRWQIEEPENQILVSDGKTLWIYDVDLEQVIVQRLSQRLDETPALLLAGKVESIQEFFTVTQLNQKGGTWYELKSRDQEGLVSKVILNFDNNVIKEMQIFDNLGQRTDISFTNIKSNIRLSDTYFTFTPPKGVEVISE
jgi:outer membrane lipoprotein carrier protein